MKLSIAAGLAGLVVIGAGKASHAQTSLEDRFIAVVAAEGCKITEAAAEVILPQHGITMDETEPLVEGMIERGVATFDDDTLTLSEKICTPSTSARKLGPREVILRDAVRATGCAMTEDQAKAALPKLGMDMDEAENIAELWIGRGMAKFEDDKLKLDAAFCAETGDVTATDVETTEPTESDKKRKAKDAEKPSPEKSEADDDAAPKTGTDTQATLLKMLRDARCRMHEDEAERRLKDLGVDPEAAGEVFTGWAKRDLAWLDEEEPEFVVIGPGLCGAHNLAEDATRERQAALVAVIKLNGCRMNEHEAEEQLPAAGFTKDEVSDMVDRLVEAGEAKLDENESVLVLTGGGC